MSYHNIAMGFAKLLMWGGGFSLGIVAGRVVRGEVSWAVAALLALLSVSGIMLHMSEVDGE